MKRLLSIVAAISFSAAVAYAGTATLNYTSSGSSPVRMTTDGSTNYLPNNTIWDATAGANGLAVNSSGAAATNLLSWAGSLIGTGTIQPFGSTQSTIGSGNVPAVNAYVTNASTDPCTGMKSTADFSSSSSGGSIITLSSGKKAYICSISIISSAAANVSLIEGTGSSVCTGGTPAGVYLNTGVTAANGGAFGANGGIQAGDGSSTVAVNATVSQNVCVLFSTGGSPQVNVHVAYVQQ